MAVYEVHLGSWRKDIFIISEMAHELANYVNRMGYTHVELMGIMELLTINPGDIR
jgi:1,4-alpha-glucan branching enzyme